MLKSLHIRSLDHTFFLNNINQNNFVKIILFKCRDFIIKFKAKQILYKNGNQTIDNNTLAALTLLIAESNPREKEVIIDLVMNFLYSE